MLNAQIHKPTHTHIIIQWYKFTPYSVFKGIIVMTILLTLWVGWWWCGIFNMIWFNLVITGKKFCFSSIIFTNFPQYLSKKILFPISTSVQFHWLNPKNQTKQKKNVKIGIFNSNKHFFWEWKGWFDSNFRNWIESRVIRLFFYIW